ncbi:major pollen allergen Ole e 10-like [Hibiscus syriacus]|uniref:major pollen allergen Ole e 10-like n=1 Tax=Hibiscus syriacus TaxID=106335 RepID=UPI001920D11A|nr:major pollen allergen Ole e 10-like [Hibiscus syriacus]
MKPLSSVAFLLHGTVVFHLLSSAAAGTIRGGGSFVDNRMKFCLPKPGVGDAQLQRNLEWACKQGIDCRPIQPGGACAEPSTVKSRAAFAMNSYFKFKGSDSACDFQGSGAITPTDPSKLEKLLVQILVLIRTLCMNWVISDAYMFEGSDKVDLS